MLSTENPPPESDTPLPCPLKTTKKFANTPHLNPSSSSSSSSLDHLRNRQTPNFRIRDYVFDVRRKDITKNWPFSRENLQLCLKHDVKQPLPPFESMDSMTNQSLKPSMVEIPSRDQKLAGKLQPDLEIECLGSDQLVSDQSTVKHPPLRSHQTENTSKKCQLLMRLSTSSEDASNTMAAMAATTKTCPVCKTFSSSSNTNLNAHIDQCLASSSKSVSLPSSRVAKHNTVKPKKMRLITDIYTTAKHCTVEELERRNGTSWADVASNSPVLDGVMSKDVNEEGERQRVSLECSRNSDSCQANVYVDANGTKVRNLSKLEDNGLIMAKKRHGRKKHKYLKLVPQSKKLSPHKVHSFKTSVDPKRHFREENQEPRRKSRPRKHVSLSDRSKQRRVPPKFRRDIDELFLRDSAVRRNRVEDPLPPKKRNIDDYINAGGSSRRRSVRRSAENDRKKIWRAAGLRKSLEESPRCGSRTFKVISSEEDDVSRENSADQENDLMQNGFEYCHGILRDSSIDGQSASDDDETSTWSDSSESDIDVRKYNNTLQDRDSRITRLSRYLKTRFESSTRDDNDDDDDENAMYEQSTCEDMDMDSLTCNGSYFPEVEPIPIPGPPGSFLPSPRDMMMASDDFPATSSLTTSAVRSSEDRRDIVEGVSSDSPLSAASTVAKSRPSDLENLECNETSAEKRDFGFRNEDRPCCCKRKEGSLSSQGFISLNFEDSQLLKRRAMTSAERETGFVPANPCLTDAPIPKMFSDIDRTTSSLSGSPPVLRLMGKNLTVINPEASAQLSRGSQICKPTPVHQDSNHFSLVKLSCGPEDPQKLTKAL